MALQGGFQQQYEIEVIILNVTFQGFGKHEEDFIESGFAFCMGGPGVVFSKGLLKQLKPKLRIVFNYFTVHLWAEVLTNFFVCSEN